MNDDRNEPKGVNISIGPQVSTLSMGPQAEPPPAEAIAKAELYAAALTFGAVGMMGNAEMVLRGVGLARRSRPEDGISMEVNFDGMDVAFNDLEAAAIAYAEAKGYRRP